MPVTLEQAKLLTQDKVDHAVIDEFRASPLLDLMVFDDSATVPAGGTTFTYGYRRLKTPSGASFRAINAEYPPTEATVEAHSVDLKVLGGAFQIDRVLAGVGSAASNAVAIQLDQKIKAVRNEFSDAVINGDSGANADSFDGLSKALAGTSTEIAPGTYDWSAALSDSTSWGIVEALDDIVGHLDGDPSVLIANKLVINKIKAALRRTNQYTSSTTALGQIRDTYGSLTLVPAGTVTDHTGTTKQIIPVTEGKTDIYVARLGLTGFHGVAAQGASLVKTYLPDFTRPGAVKTGEAELGPVALALRATKAAAVARDVQIAPATP